MHIGYKSSESWAFSYHPKISFLFLKSHSTTLPFISSAIMKATGCDSFNLLVNNGAEAGQTHIHIIPRKARDCLWPSESLRRHPLKLDQNTFKLVNCVQEELCLFVILMFH
ncbi:hypothetical protein CIPAW_14G045900 [Carya illinoinensis]|uniref:HIT domain-containing protein n=1 Tax=Carya illinoinensis TaxID=32201 RepID=A0A8T1NEW5_CARIL|nr:hypothetical protein CIPAW_14G045900 [Carya illinoinensis]